MEARITGIKKDIAYVAVVDAISIAPNRYVVKGSIGEKSAQSNLQPRSSNPSSAPLPS
jgi:hypothetical protein